MQVTGSTGVTEIEQRTLRKVVWRLVPFLMLCYLLAFIDRGNVGMASLQKTAWALNKLRCVCMEWKAIARTEKELNSCTEKIMANSYYYMRKTVG